MARIASFGAYVPLYRLSRQQIGDAWGIPAVPGERAVANADEDSLTMAVAAGLDCLAGIGQSTIDGLFFATTTAPYSEKQSAGIVAAALDMRRDINTADFTGSLRAATTAMRAAIDAVDSGSARSVLVVAADCRLGEPESMFEQLLGDGAGAVLISKDGPVAIRGAYSLAGEQVGAWRRSEDRYVRSFESKVETQYGYATTAVAAGKTLMEKEGVTADGIAKAVITASDPRSYVGVGKALGFEATQLQDTLFLSVGSPGAALAFMMLAGALEQAQAGDRILLLNHGDGADALLLEVAEAIPAAAGRKGLTGHLFQKRQLPSYTAYAHFRHLTDREQPPAEGSPVTYWRDAAQELNFIGAHCKSCGAVQYPPPRVCAGCGTKDSFENVKLPRKGTVYTYTLDHLSGGQYLNVPIPRIVIDLAEVHDCFSITEILNYQDLGFCEQGQGAAFVTEGRSEVDGDLPVNASGGLKCFGHPIGATGCRMLYEITKQLQGRADGAQVKDPRLGLAHNLGGPGSVCSVTILGRKD